jgi:hypothetical protein
MRWLPLAMLLALASCASPRPLEPLAPRYPDMLRSADMTGVVIAAVRVSRTGEVTAIRFDSVALAHDLFRRSVGLTLKNERFAPARMLGFPRAGEATYVVRFVLLLPDSLSRASERSPAADTMPVACPAPKDKNEILVCAKKTPSRSRVLY